MQNDNRVDEIDLSAVASLAMDSSIRTLRVRAQSNSRCEGTSHFTIFNFHYSLIILFFANVSIASIACSYFSLLAPAIADESFRPEVGKFPPEDKAVAYTGELTFVDHANRRGSLRVPVEDVFFRQAGRPFALLPYGMVYYRGAPADLRDIPLGTILHGRFYLPPDPKFSSVPNVNQANHAILLEDEPSFCLRQGKAWKLKELEMRGDEGMVVACRVSKSGGEADEADQKFTVDDTTSFWRGREKLRLDEVVAEGIWPSDGKTKLDDQIVMLGLTWQPMNDFWKGAFNGYHISDIWFDDSAMQRASEYQRLVHKEFIQGRWMPGWVDKVEYGNFGRAMITATLFGGMDPSLYADFQKGREAQIGAATTELKHEHGAYSHAHMAIRGPVLDVIKSDGDIPLGSSGIQIRMNVDLVLEGFRPGRIIRIRPMNWPADSLPREEWIDEGSMEGRFPSSDIFTKQ